MYRLLDEDGLFQQWIIKEPAKISGYQRVWNGMFMCGKSKWVSYQSGTIGVSLAAENEGSVTTLCRRRTSARRAFRISFPPPLHTTQTFKLGGCQGRSLTDPKRDSNTQSRLMMFSKFYIYSTASTPTCIPTLLCAAFETLATVVCLHYKSHRTDGGAVYSDLPQYRRPWDLRMVRFELQ